MVVSLGFSADDAWASTVREFFAYNKAYEAKHGARDAKGRVIKPKGANPFKTAADVKEFEEQVRKLGANI